MRLNIALALIFWGLLGDVLVTLVALEEMHEWGWLQFAGTLGVIAVFTHAIWVGVRALFDPSTLRGFDAFN